MRIQLPPRPNRLAILARVQAELARGPMSVDEEALFASQQAEQDRAAWLRRHPEQTAHELPLALGG